MRCFADVTVGFPADAYQAKENWQNTNWVLWSRAELRVDPASFALVFLPSGVGRLAAKPIGCLTGAAQIAAAETGGIHTFVASTNDPYHGLIRLTFSSQADEDAFGELAQSAEMASSGCYTGSASRCSTICTSRRSSMCGRSRDDAVVEAIAAHVIQQYPSSVPLVFGGAELYGPDPHGESGSEVLLGRGAVVLVDPIDGCRLGNYDMFFYEESSAEPCLRLPIAPRTRIMRQPDNAVDRLSIASRLTLGGAGSARPSCTATVFNVMFPGSLGWAVAFDTETEAAGFERDFCVRQRLVTMSLRTSRGWRTVDDLQRQLMEFRHYGVLATLRWFASQSIVLLALLFVLHAAVLYSNDPSRPLLDVAAVALQDASAMFFIFSEKASETGAATCGFFLRAVPASAVERCTALPFAEDTRSCVASLVAAVA